MSLPCLRSPFLAGALAAAALTMSLAHDARADGPVSPTGKGTVGGALLGGEVVAITMGAVGVHQSWPYYILTPLGIAGGAAAGYALDNSTKGSTGATAAATSQPNAEPSLYLLAGGMALVIPALVVALNATAYHPSSDERNDPANNEPSATPAPGPLPTGAAGPTSSADSKDGKKVARKSQAPHVPLSMFDIYQGKLALGVPALEVRPLYTQREIAEYGVAQGAELKIPVFQAAF